MLGRNKKSDSVHDIDMFHLANDDSPFMYKESYRNLRTNLEFLTLDQDKKVISVTSSISGEGKSCISINLALILSASKKKVLLIDADLRKPSVHKYLKQINQKGLSSIIYTADGNIQDNIINVPDLNFDIMLSGPKCPNPAELLGSRRMEELISILKKYYDYIVIDTSPVGVVTDAAILSKVVDGMVYVVKQNYATKPQITAAYKNLTNVNANVLGVILNQYDFERDSKSLKGEYYYNYYYSYYYYDSENPDKEENGN